MASGAGPAVVVINIILAILTTAAVCLRFWSRKLTGAGWRLDDWLSLASLGCGFGLCLASVLAVHYGGLGKDQATALADDPYAVTSFLMILYVAEYGYAAASALVKLAVVAFYWRVFPTETVKRGVQAIGSLCIAWFVAVILTNLLQCRPISAFWNPTGSYTCIDLIMYFFGNSIANFFIDLFTLILPVREVLRLHVSQSKRNGLVGVFLLGGIVVLASMIRTISLLVLWKTGVTDVTGQYGTMWIATCVEIYIAIIGGCLPTLVPTYRQLRYGRPDGSTAASRTGYGHQTPLKGSNVMSSHIKFSQRSHVLEQGEGDFELLNKGER